ELAVKRLPPEAARVLLIDWAQRTWLAEYPDLREILARQLLRLSLLGPGPSEVLSAAGPLLADAALPRLAEAVRPGGDASSPDGDAPLARLWRAAVLLARRPPPPLEKTSKILDGSHMDYIL